MPVQLLIPGPGGGPADEIKLLLQVIPACQSNACFDAGELCTASGDEQPGKLYGAGPLHPVLCGVVFLWCMACLVLAHENGWAMVDSLHG
eukprot:1141570-Pelagomonas_calceolata.AAC.1